MTYTHASSKSEKDLISYQSVRGAETKAIYETIREGTSLSSIEKKFVKPTETSNSKSVKDTIQFLHATDFLERPSERTVEPLDGQPFGDLPFELQLFHHLSQQEAPQDHFIEVAEVIANQDQITYDKDDLLEDLKRELGSYPFDWNIEKVQMWYNMMAPMGLVSVRDNQELLTSPSPAVVYDLLDAYRSRENDHRLRSAFDWVEKNFFSCYASRGGIPRVHRGLSDTLGTLVSDGVLDLEAPSDATYEVKVSSANADKVSSFTLHERPQRPAYRYPLDAHEIEVKA
ncbi:hypothetical protein [Haloarchaeobius amylolyticus]|uniref:hypothetical protein n=1 Tax=Haloarchaeobius amylolyticus TaxID=1198296 RepID=UPI00226EBA32|nr:hypothetical protein [Haloarchaeobius amylolyticus]